MVISLNGFTQPAIPKFESFKAISSKSTHSERYQPVPFGQNNPLLPNDPYKEQNLRILHQSGIMPVPGSPTSQQTVNELMEEERKDAHTTKEQGKMAWSKSYQNNFEQFLQMNPDNFSITKAIYLTESAWFENPPPYEEFEGRIKEWAVLVKQIIKKEGLNEKDNTAIMYGIQKLYSQPNEYFDIVTKKSYPVSRLQYSFDDYMGDKDWRNMFVTKLLRTKTGQCHSLPLLFLCIAEQLNAKAWLSLSPNHSFIQYFDKKGNRFNFETTNGNLVSQAWLSQSTYVTASALKNKTYLDTLPGKKLYAQCLGDLLLGYIMKIRFDDFSDRIIQKILEVDSTNLTALGMQARLYHFIFQDLLSAANNPSEKDYPKYPELNAAFQQLQHYKQKIEHTGFQLMPREAYQAWLKSLETEKQQQQNRAEAEKLQREIKKLKNVKSTFINKPKQ